MEEHAVAVLQTWPNEVVGVVDTVHTWDRHEGDKGALDIRDVASVDDTHGDVEEDGAIGPIEGEALSVIHHPIFHWNCSAK